MKPALERPGAERADRFKRLRTRRDVAELLEVPVQTLIWHLYRYPEHRRYRTFTIRKADGSDRQIDAPNSAIKLLQRKLLEVLEGVYNPSRAAVGFVCGRNIRTNASAHRSKRWVLNVDISSFFHSIHFGRVRGMFMSKPYLLGEEAATTLAQLACWQGVLPQGSPCSPIIANMICGRLDAQLISLGRRFRCDYTRYADDITFSTNQRDFPEALARNEFNGENLCCIVGNALRAAIDSNGFSLKPEKARLRGYWQRQEVTGLVVNNRISVSREYARALRAALHNWERHGESVAEADWRGSFDLRKGERGREFVSFRRFVEGRLSHMEFANGRTDQVTSNLRRLFDRLTGAPSRLDPMVVVETVGDQGCSQGTGFWLAGVGLVTCAHVVEGASEVVVRSPTLNSEWLQAFVDWADDSADVALLIAKSTTRKPLDVSARPATLGDVVTVLGYPSADSRHSHFESEGVVIQHKTHMSHPVHLVSADIVAGASGGPVLDTSGRVLGMARSGERVSGSNPLQEKSIVPVETIVRLALEHRNFRRS